MELRQLFAALGGQREVARRLGVGATAVSNWAVRGRLPATHQLVVWEMALEAGVQWEPPGADRLRHRLYACAPTAQAPAA